MRLRTYVPSFRANPCEFAALRGIPPDIYRVLTPRIITGNVGESRERFKNHLTKLAVKHLGGAPILGQAPQRFYLDCEKSLDFTSNAVEFAIELSEHLARQGLDVNPVLTPKILAAANTDQIHTISEYFDNVAIRVGRSDARAFENDKNIRRIFRRLDLIVGGSTLIFDAGQICEGHLFHYPSDISRAIKNFCDAIDIDKIILSSASFPESVSRIGAMKHGSFPRYDLRLWQEVIEKSGLDGIEFGDHGTIHRRFEPGRIPPKYHRGTIRYTSDRRFHVFRGIPNVRKSLTQYHELAAMLVKSGVFRGAGYSASEHATVEVANKARQPGDPQIWTTRALVQHIVFVSRSLNEAEAQEAILG